MMQIYNWKEFAKENNVDTSIFDDILGRLPTLSKDEYIAGGALCDTILGKKPKDIDIFFSNKVAREEFAKKIISGKSATISGMTEAGRAIAGKHHVLFVDKQVLLDSQTSISIQMVGGDGVSRFGFQTILERVSNADFTVTQFVYDGTYLYCGDTSISDLKNHILVPNNLDILDFQKRVKRYEDKGFIKNPKIALLEYEIAIATSRRKYKERMTLIDKR